MAVMQQDEYERMYRVENQLWWYKSLRVILQWSVGKFVRIQGKVLDAGCGTGKNLLTLQAMGFETVGIDVSKDAITFAKKRGIKHAFKGSLLKIPYPKNTFDCVVCTDVLTTLAQSDAKRAVGEIYRILKPNGIAIVQVAAIQRLLSQHDTVVSVQHRYNKQELLELFHAQFWKTIKCSYRIFFLFPLVAGVKIYKKIINQKAAVSDTTLPPRILNRILNTFQSWEDSLFRYINYPFGTSLFLITQKKIGLIKNQHKVRLPSLTIFFPFYNDEGTVEKAIHDAFFYGSALTKNLEVIAIVGGKSKDQTYERILQAKKKHPKLVILNKEDNWEGYAVIKYGFENAKKEWVFYTDGDLQYHLDELPKLAAVQQATNADIVNGYKLRRTDPFLRVLIGNLYQKFVKYIFHLPVRDTTCDYRLIRRSYLDKFLLLSHDASVLTELIAKLYFAGAHFAEVPVKHYRRIWGQSNYTPYRLFKERIMGDFRLWGVISDATAQRVRVRVSDILNEE